MEFLFFLLAANVGGMLCATDREHGVYRMLYAALIFFYFFLMTNKLGFSILLFSADDNLVFTNF